MPVAQRTVAAAPAKATTPTPQPKKELVCIATLVRGRVYFYKETRFDVGVPVVVDRATAKVLEDFVAETRDGDGDAFEKPLFNVEYDVPPPAPADEEAPAKKRSMRLPVRPLPRR